MTVCENGGKSQLSKESLFSGCQMMHVVTEKPDGGHQYPGERKLQGQQIISFALFTMGHLIVH